MLDNTLMALAVVVIHLEPASEWKFVRSDTMSTAKNRDEHHRKRTSVKERQEFDQAEPVVPWD